MPILPLCFALTGLALALAYGFHFNMAAPSARRSAIKAGSVLALAGAGFVSGAPPLVLVGLVLGALGDLCLSRPGERAFLAGMAAFAAGHLCYAVAFHTGGMPPVPAALVLLAMAFSTEIWLAPRTGPLGWPVRAYVVVITLMALAALTLPAHHWPATLGAMLFLLSDLLLALDLFVFKQARQKRILGRLLWTAYWGGQALILWGMLPAHPG